MADEKDNVVVEKKEAKFISPEDLTNYKMAKLAATQKVLEGQNAELQFKNLVLNMFMKYGLKLEDSFDENTGEVKEASI